MGHATPEFRGGVVYVVNAVYAMSTCRKKGLSSFALILLTGHSTFLTLRIQRESQLTALDVSIGSDPSELKTSSAAAARFAVSILALT